MRLLIAVLLGKSKVDDVDEVAFLTQSHEEIVRFDISVDEVLRMHVLQPADLFVFKVRTLFILVV